MLLTPTPGRAVGRASLWPTVRSAGLGTAVVVGAAAALPAAATTARGGDDLSMALVVASIVAPTGLAVAVDDDAEPLTDASPTQLWQRRGLRLSILGLVLTGTWAIAALLAAASPDGFGNVGARLAEGAACGGVASAVAAVLRRRRAPERVGLMAGLVALLAVLTISTMANRWSLLPAIGDDTDRRAWLIVAAATWIATAWGARDPARRGCSPLRRCGRAGAE